MKNIKYIVCLIFLVYFIQANSQDSLEFGDDYHFESHCYYEYIQACPVNNQRISTISHEWNNYTINNGINTDIVLKLNVNQIPNGAQIIVYINGEVEEHDWQEGQTYVFKTQDGSGNCTIDFIGLTGYSDDLDVRMTYYEISNGEISDFDDRLNYYRTSLVDRQEKYVDQPMSVLIADMDKYQVPVSVYYFSSTKANYIFSLST